MNSRYGLQLLYCLLHMLAWIRSQPVANNTEVSSIFQGKTFVTEGKRESSEKVYTEGGSISTVVEEEKTKHKSTLEDQDFLLPLSESTSKIKPRKEAVIPNKIVARKGALLVSVSPAPVYESSTQYISTSTFSTSTPLSTTKEPIVQINSSSSSLPIEPSTAMPVPHKPKVTLVPSDSDEFLKSIKSDRNVVIPVLALVLVPLIVLLALFIYKRVQDSGGAYYTQVDFLVDEMYND